MLPQYVILISVVQEEKLAKVSKKEVCLKFRRRTRKVGFNAEEKIKANSGRQ